MDYSQEIEQLSARYRELVSRERNSEQILLDSYRETLAQLRARWDQLPQVPEPPLTILKIFGRSGDENFISDYLAYILDPEKNGIGTEPLERFLELCEVDAHDLSWENFSIRREKTLDQGRIDFLLVWEDELVVGIENKIYSQEHNNQTLRYEQDIFGRFGNVPIRLVYLSPRTQEPASKKFIPVLYGDLLEALRPVKLNPEIGLRKYVLWEDFLEHLEAYIMADPQNFEFSPRAMMYIEHHQMIEDLVKEYRTRYGALIEWLEERMREHLAQEKWEMNFNRSANYWHQISKPTWGAERWRVHYEYWLSVSRLKANEVDFMVDVEGREANALLQRFDQLYPSIQAEYQKRGIAYRPSNRRLAIAWKTYSIPHNWQEIADVFIAAFEEFGFLEPEIDAVIVEMLATKK